MPAFKQPNKKIPSSQSFLEKFVYAGFLIGFILIAYLYYLYEKNIRKPQYTEDSPLPLPQTPPVMVAISTRNSPEYDGPPLRNDDVFFSNDIRGGIPLTNGPIAMNRIGIPINQETRGCATDYSQVGILTRIDNDSKNDKMILPFMGRRVMSRPEKWQYYTTSNTGQVNTRLPVKFNGKSCTSEQGCDFINSGDIIFVEGYNEKFRATIYENSVFRYIPYI